MFIHKGVFSYEEEWDYVICREMDGMGDYFEQWKPNSEKQVSNVSLICGI
jgi:hypothetical protein